MKKQSGGVRISAGERKNPREQMRSVHVHPCPTGLTAVLLSNCLLGGRALALGAGAISQHLCHLGGSSSLSEPPCPYLDDAGNGNAHLPQK